MTMLDAFCRILEDGGFGSDDAFLRTLQSQAGSVGLMRSNKTRERKDETSNAEQLDIFEVFV